jgi:hypothetical protein
MRLVPFEGEIVISEIEDRCDSGVEHHLWEWVWRPGELECDLLIVVAVDMAVTPGPNEFTETKASYLRHHHRE